MHLALRLSYRWLLFLVLCCAAPAAAQPAATAEMADPLADPLAALLEQARALMTRGEPAAALQVLEQAPPDPRVVFARTHALSTLGRHTEAAQSLEGYLRAPPQDSASAAQVADAQRWLDGGTPAQADPTEAMRTIWRVAGESWGRAVAMQDEELTRSRER